MLESIVLISSNLDNNQIFGTGFVVDSRSNLTRIVTCAHVIRDVGKDNVLVDGINATVLTPIDTRYDIAVLEVKDFDRPTIPIGSFGRKNLRAKIIGFSKFENDELAARPLTCNLGEQIALSSLNDPEKIIAWDLLIDDEFSYLRKGYSGAPVIDDHGRVIAITSHMQIIDGQKGHAVDISHLKSVWTNIPPHLELLDSDSHELVIDDYQFDLFLSYGDEFVGPWVRQVLFKQVEILLLDYLGRRPRIFLAKVTENDQLPYNWKIALATSKCIMPVWCPSYFEKDWAWYESSAIVQRQANLNFGPINSEFKLAIACIASDCMSFNDYRNEIKTFNCRPYLYPPDAIKYTPKYALFIDEMRVWMHKLGENINNAPNWDSRWVFDSISFEKPVSNQTGFSAPSIS